LKEYFTQGKLMMQIIIYISPGFEISFL